MSMHDRDLTIDLSSDLPGSEQVISFGTHANYLRAFAMLVGGLSAGEDAAASLFALRARVHACSGCRERQATLDPATRNRVVSSLKNAWGSEAWLAAGGKFATEGELLGLANNWGVVQAYYACYHATQALLVAKGFPRPDSHPKTQRQYMSLWVERPLQLAPWTLGYGHEGFINVPVGMVIDDSISQLSTCTDRSCWDLVGKALRTTRADAVKEALRRAREAKRRDRERAWNEEEANQLARGLRPRALRRVTVPRLGAEEKDRIGRGVRAYGLIDYLYRLRIRSNYEDATMFTEGPLDRQQPRQVNSDLCHIASSTLLVHELRIAQIVGQDLMRRWVDNWLERNNVANLGLGLALRRDLLIDT